MSVTPQMVKLSDLDQLSPDDLWRRRAAIHDAVVARVLASGPLAPAITCCPICGSSQLCQFSVKSGLNIDRCASCDFQFTNPPPSAEQLNLYYNSEAKELEESGVRAHAAPAGADLCAPRGIDHALLH